MKFSAGNEIKIKTTFDRDREMLRVYIIDKGKGINQNDIEKLYEFFGRSERENSNEQQ